MRLFSYLSVAVLLVSGVVLTAYSPDLLSMVIVGFMCMITLAGCIYGLLPTISFTGGLLNGQNGIRKASGTEGSSAWVAALRIERAAALFGEGMSSPLMAGLRERQGLNRFRRRGLRGVRLEFRLHLMAYNLGRALVYARRGRLGRLLRFACFIQPRRRHVSGTCGKNRHRHPIRYPIDCMAAPTSRLRASQFYNTL